MRTLSTCILLGSMILLVAFSVCAQETTEQVAVSFTGMAGPIQGAKPLGSLVADSNGSLYGTALQGGASNQGVVFKLDASNVYTELYAFNGHGDGGFPRAGLVLDAMGNLYGTASCGGSTPCAANGVGGNGVVFELSPATQGYSFKVLYAFAGGADGSRPYAALIFSSNTLYGTTTHGGAGTCTDSNGTRCGVVFSLAISGGTVTESVLYRFKGRPDGGFPMAGLIRGVGGSLMGTTYHGGTLGFGTIFAVSGTNQETVLHSFSGTSDGGLPEAGLVADASGNLYGTATCGGNGTCARGAGVVFRLTGINLTPLYSFTSPNDGAFPAGGVIFDGAGNLVGTTRTGSGSATRGTVYELTQASGYTLETVLHTFAGGLDGQNPMGGVVPGNPGDSCSVAHPESSSPAPTRPKCPYCCGVTVSAGSFGYGVLYH